MQEVDYRASPAETTWLSAVERHRPLSCTPWREDGPLRKLAVAQRSTLEAQAPSRLILRAGSSEQVVAPIEPLVGSLRHPMLLTRTDSARAVARLVMNKSYLQPPPAALVVKLAPIEWRRYDALDRLVLVLVGWLGGTAALLALLSAGGVVGSWEEVEARWLLGAAEGCVALVSGWLLYSACAAQRRARPPADYTVLQ